MRVVLLIFTLLMSGYISAAPKTALVLSGGGAKGGAHIGVLKVLEQHNIDIDMVVGTSMGAVVGGLYASGYNAAQIESILTNADWGEILLNNIDSKVQYYRRKRDDDIFLIRETLGIGPNGLLFPRSAVQGHKLYQAFKKYTIIKDPVGHFDCLPIPFRAVATSLISGETVVLDSGDLALAMYSSMAVPGLLSPIEMNGRLLVDGGMVSNIPIEIAKKMGAERVIVVDVTAPMLKNEEITSVGAVLDQVTNLQVKANMQASLELLNENDIYIRPGIDDIFVADYDKLDDAIKPGIDAAESVFGQIEGYEQNGEITEQKVFIRSIRLNNNTCLHDKTYLHYLPKAPTWISPQDLDDMISTLYGLELFEKIVFRLEGDTLVVEPILRSWGPNYLQGAFLLNADFDGNSAFTFAAGISKTLINSYAGEYRLIGSLGQRTSVFTEWYQPFTHDLQWYGSVQAGYLREMGSLYINNDEINRFLVSEVVGSVAVGRNIGHKGRIQASYIRLGGSNRLQTGVSVLPESNFDQGLISLRAEWDQLENPFFPRSGTYGVINYEWYRSGLGGDTNFEQLETQYLYAKSFDAHHLLFNASYSTTTSERSSFNAEFNLGGLFRLSGLAANQLRGQEAALFDVIYYYHLSDISFIPNYPFPIYVGSSIEMGNTWEDKASLFKHSFRKAGSLFIGLDTIIGPFYLGYGFSENGKRAAHLFMGRPF